VYRVFAIGDGLRSVPSKYASIEFIKNLVMISRDN